MLTERMDEVENNLKVFCKGFLHGKGIDPKNCLITFYSEDDNIIAFLEKNNSSSIEFSAKRVKNGFMISAKGDKYSYKSIGKIFTDTKRN
jgi:hypothetical protein